ncbi:MAG: transposase [Saprospiraceae bacterium]|nr:transposase [Saprospiraceae bacterium]
MKTKFIIGADISKSKINFCLFIDSKNHMEREVENDKDSLKKFIKEVSSLKKSFEKSNKCCVDLVFACEFTGIYNYILTTLLHNMEIATYVIHALKIKQSMGMSREKNDKIDAIMIAEYTFRFHDKLSLWKPDDETISKLKHLETLRSRYVKIKKQITQSDDDNNKFMEATINEKIKEINNPVIDEIENAINKIETQMLGIIKKNEALKKNYEILNTVPGIGPVIARSLICITNNFTKFDSAKQFGCYCEVVPFNKQSGNYKGKKQSIKTCQPRHEKDNTSGSNVRYKLQESIWQIL